MYQGKNILDYFSEISENQNGIPTNVLNVVEQECENDT